MACRSWGSVCDRGAGSDSGSSRACIWVPLPWDAACEGWSGYRDQPVRRDSRYIGSNAYGERERTCYTCSCKCNWKQYCPWGGQGVLYTGRTGDFGCDNKGIQCTACGFGLYCGSVREGEGADHRRAVQLLHFWTSDDSGQDREDSSGQGENPVVRSQICECTWCFLCRSWSWLCSVSGRKSETERDFLYSFRGLCSRWVEAWNNQSDRGQHSCDRSSDTEQAVWEDSQQYDGM